MRYVTFLSFMFLVTCTVDNKGVNNDPLISGHVTNSGIGYITLEQFEGATMTIVDTLEVDEEGMFSGYFHPEEPGYYRLNFYQTQFISLILTDEHIQLEVDAKSPMAPYTITGSRTMDHLISAEEVMKAFRDQTSDLENKFREAAQNEDEEQMAILREQYGQAQQSVNEEIKKMLRGMINSVAVIQAINYLDKDAEYEFVDSVATIVDQNMPDYKIKRDFINQINKLRQVAIGSIAPEIALPDPDGNIIKLSSLKGKYVLLDFWAGWCGPCRMENPNVLKLYKQYKDNGFEVFGISLDRDRDSWLKAIKDDGIVWIQVSDLKYFNSQAAFNYNIQAIPATFLLDPEGRIVEKNLRGESLKNKLEEIFGG